MEFAVEFFESEQVRGNIFANGGVRTTAGFDSADSFGRKCVVTNQEFAVLFGEDVVGHGGNVHFVAKESAELEHECGFSASYGSANTNREGALLEIAVQRQIAFVKVAGVIEMLVGMAVVGMGMEKEAHINFGKDVSRDDPGFPGKGRSKARFEPHHPDPDRDRPRPFARQGD